MRITVQITAELHEEIIQLKEALRKAVARGDMYQDQLLARIEVRPVLSEIEQRKGALAERQRCVAICREFSRRPDDLGSTIARRIQALND